MKGFGHSLRVGASIVALTLAGQALAQSAEEQPAPQEVGDEDPQLLPREDTGNSVSEDDDQDVIVVTGTNISGVKQVGSQSIVLSREAILSSGKNSVAEVLATLPQVQTVSGADSFTPGVAGESGSSQTGIGGNSTRGTAINLRGVGQGATLTLVDGHRITPSGTASAFTEANQVPMAAVERIEVIADGASAVYGSDAIAGVINYVLRKNFTGLELSGRYTAGKYGNDQWAVSAVGGVNWNLGIGSGNIIATFEYSRRDPFLRGSNPRLREDQRPYGGNDARVGTGGTASIPVNGNIVIPTAANPFPFGTAPTNPNFPQGGANIFYALPLNPTGRILTVADLQEVRSGSCAGAATPTCATYPNVIDRSDYEDYLSKQTRKQAAVFLSQEIGGLELYNEFFWTRSDQFTRTFAGSNGVTNPTLTINPGSAYYGPLSSLPNLFRFNPNNGSFGQQPITVQYNIISRLPNGPVVGNQNFEESFNNTFGGRIGISADWKAEAYYNFGQNKTCGVCYLGNFISFEANNLAGLPAISAIQQLVNLPAGDPLALNPLSTAPFTRAQLDYILGNNEQYAQNWSHDIVAKVDGSLFEMPAGPWKAAFGGEYYSGIQKLQNQGNRPPDRGPVTTPDANARTARKQWAVFGELYMPVISPEMEVPLIREFTVNGALRHDDYSDFGKTTNGKVSATLEPFEGLRLRGSWGTSFRAPGLPQLNSGAFSFALGGRLANLPPEVSALLTGTRSGGPNSVNVINIIGSNPNLKAETGTNWQVGADFTPTFVPGLRLSGTYYNLTYANKLGQAGVPFSIFDFAPGALGDVTQFNRYAPYILSLNNVRGPNGCTSLDPRLQEFSGFLYTAVVGFNPRDFCNADVLIDARSISAAKTVQKGIDFSVNYVKPTDIGTFAVNLGASHILSNREALVAGAPLVTRLDTVGDPISWRGRGSVSYSTGPLALTLFGNYVGSYLNNRPITLVGAAAPLPQTRIPSWTTFDLNVAFSFVESEKDWAFLKNVRISLNVSNLFDKEPPIVLSQTSGNSSIDLFAHNPFGRSMQISVTKAF